MSKNNLVVLRGVIVGEPRSRELASGTVLVQFEVTTRDEVGTQSVPAVWFDPPATGLLPESGVEVVVVGSVRRRFFRAGGATQSRTEVVIERVVAATRRREADRAIVAAQAALSPA